MMKKWFVLGGYFFSNLVLGQKIINQEILIPFMKKLSKNEQVSQVLFIGDSHIQAGWLVSYLRDQFQEKYGNAGRGLVFPYEIANSNGPLDFSSSSNQTWENFRLVYDQNVFPQIGASGFVIGNHKDSFLEIDFKEVKDSFDKVIIFNDEEMKGALFSTYKTDQILRNFISYETEKINYQIDKEMTFPEIASHFYTTTTKLKLINGVAIQNPKIGMNIKIEEKRIRYNSLFENQIHLISNQNLFSKSRTELNYKTPQTHFLIRSNVEKGNIFYGFQFLKNVKKGVVFNTVGVNGATYQDFLKYPLQLQQLQSIHPDILIIALGTNESLSRITKEEFLTNATELIQNWKKNNSNLPILLIAPPENKAKSEKVREVNDWVREVAQTNQVAYFSLYDEMGGKGYFKKTLLKKQANTDGIHFLKPAYEAQAQKIWQAFENLLNN